MRERAKAWAVFFVVLLMSGYARGQINPSFFTTSPPNPVGSGARAMGVGGAFIAVGDDATAASWNPGCLIQLEKPEASFVLTEDFRNIDGNNVDFFDVNYLSVAYPFTIKKSKPLFGQNDINMIVSLNYQRLFDFYFDSSRTLSSIARNEMEAQMLTEGDNTPGSPTEFDTYTMNDDLIENHYKLTSKQIGDLGALAPAFAIQITPKFSLGFTYNFWRDGWLGKRQNLDYEETHDFNFAKENGLWWDQNGNCTCNGGNPCDSSSLTIVDDPACLEMPIPESLLPFPNPDYSEPTDFHFKMDTETTMRMQGQNFNLGMLWDLNGRWSLGAVYRSPIKMDVKRTVKITYFQDSSDPLQIIPRTTTTAKYDDSVYFPASYGIGVGYRYSDALSFTSDVTRIEWNNYLYKPEGGEKYSLVNGLKKSKAGVDPTYTARAGAEYLIIKPKYVVPLRAGFFYDPEPAKDKPDNVYGITMGTGFAYKRVAMDLTYYYRWGNNIILHTDTDASREHLEVRRGNLQQHMVMFSTIVYFE